MSSGISRSGRIESEPRVTTEGRVASTESHGIDSHSEEEDA
jgi:hypothetical protein